MRRKGIYYELVVAQKNIYDFRSDDQKRTDTGEMPLSEKEAGM